MISFTTIALVVIGFAIYSYFTRKEKGHPPGPTGIPLFGNLLSLGGKPHIKLDEWGKKYGGIFKIMMGSNPAVVITDPKLMREAMNDANFTGRPNNKAFQLLSEGKHGIISNDGEHWVEQRRFTLRNLRDFGFGKNSMEAIVMDEIQVVLNWMKKEEGHPVVLDRKFSLSVLNALWTIMTGERYDHDDPKLTHILDFGNKTFNEATASGIPVFFPQLAERFPNLTGWNKLLGIVKTFVEMFEEAVRDHELNPAPEGQPRDFIDVYMEEIKKTTDPRSSFYKGLGRKSLVTVVGDLHGAGSETTSQTLNWAILYLVRHPAVQKKLQDEIDDVIGRNRLPCLEDRPKMPYTQALIMEVLRLSSLVPMGVFHNTMADVEFHGYKIPKDTMVILNQYSAHYSKVAWGDPENFRPERFLATDGKSTTRADSFVAFGTGKRACLGETLARDELFLFITSIFQKFEIKADPAHPNPTMEGKSGFTLSPHPFSVVMKDRLV